MNKGLLWIAGAEQSKAWVHKWVVVNMLAFDSSTKEGMCNFNGFITTVQFGGTGKRGRNNFVPTPVPCNGVRIDLWQESADNPLHLHMKVFGRDFSRLKGYPPIVLPAMWSCKRRDCLSLPKIHNHAMIVLVNSSNISANQNTTAHLNRQSIKG